MLEILYDDATNEVRAWNADTEVQGNLNPIAGQAIVIWDINPPAFESDVYLVDADNKQIIVNPGYVAPTTLKERLVAEATKDGKLDVLIAHFE